MLTRFLCVLCAFAVFTCAFPAVAKAASEIAVVDIEKILNESKAGKALKKQLEKKRKEFQNEFSSKEKSLQDSAKKLIEKKDEMEAEKLAAERKKFETQLLETRKLFQKRRASLDRGLTKAMQKLRREVIEIAAALAEEKKYKAILMRDSVVIVQKELDETDELLKRLDKKVSSVDLKVE